MQKIQEIRVDFKVFRKAVIKANRLLADDLRSRSEAPLLEIERTARLLTFRLLFLLSAGARRMMDIPDMSKSPRPFIQNIQKWLKDNPPHSRRYFSYSDLFEPRKQPMLWRLSASDEALRSCIDMMVELNPAEWPVTWPGEVYPHIIDPLERKEKGSFYTPEPIVRYIVEQALGPLCYRMPERKKAPREPEKILSIRVLDPAMGNGRFLVAATDYLAEALAAARKEDVTVSKRIEIMRNCIYGVDRDPLVIDLARIALWLHLRSNEIDASFLRNHIQHGDSLWGATIQEMELPIENFIEDAGQLTLFAPDIVREPPIPLKKLAESGRMIERIRALANLWTSIRMNGEKDAIELYSHARASIGRASDERWAEFDAHPAMQRARMLLEEHRFLHWELKFHDVFFPKDNRPGGFSAVIGNPPYRKERGSGEESIARLSPVGRNWSEGKMDLIGLFLHRGIDLIEPNGRLSYITSSYWLKAEGAKRLRARLAENENLVEFLDLGEAPIFPGLSGRHCIVTAGKGRSHSPTRIITVKPEKEKHLNLLENLSEGRSEYFDSFEINDQRNILDDNGDYHLGDREIELLCRKMEACSTPLESIVKSTQGVVDNPPELSEKIIASIKEANPEIAEEMNYLPGEHVFLIPTGHSLLDELSEEERSLLRPFYRTGSIRQYTLPPLPDAYLLFLTPITCPDVNRFPNIKKHLERFRPVMEMRREVKLGRIRWWHLHWPRDPQIFAGEHLLLPQMVEYPTAALTQPFVYSGISTHVVAEPNGVSIRFIEAIINSRAVRFWLDQGQRAKRRGLRLDITLSALRKIPTPKINSLVTGSDVDAEVEKLFKIYNDAFS